MKARQAETATTTTKPHPAIGVRFDPETLRQLRAAAKANHRTVSQEVRLAVQRHLETYKDAI